MNLFIFLVFIFSMSYFDWGIIKIPFYVINQNQSDFIVKGYLSLYINLLYGKQISLPYYQTYPSISRQVCLPNDIYCQSIFQELICVGTISFIVLMIGSLIQVYDIYTMIRYFVSRETIVDYRQEKQDNLRHFVTIGHFIIGITLNIFGLYFMEVEIILGVSFWVFIGGIVLFIAVIIIEQIALMNLRKQKLILALLQG